MDEYRHCESIYTTDDGISETVFGSAIVTIDNERMTMHHIDPSGYTEDWRGNFENGQYHILKMEDGQPTGAYAKLSKIERVLAGGWADKNQTGGWNIVLK